MKKMRLSYLSPKGAEERRLPSSVIKPVPAPAQLRVESTVQKVQIIDDYNEIAPISSDDNQFEQFGLQSENPMSFQEEEQVEVEYPIDEEAIDCVEAMRRINDSLSAGAEQERNTLNLS